MSLRSEQMQLSTAERGWLNWFGKTGKLKMGWACRLNRGRYALMEKAFESIANTRIKLLQQWVKRQWTQLESTRGQLHLSDDSFENLLQKNWRIMSDCSELFIIDHNGCVLASTYLPRVRVCDLPSKAVAIGLEKPFLHGPYIDSQTLGIGKRSSVFHDEVTLMFY